MSLDTSPEAPTAVEPLAPVGTYQFDDYGHGNFEPLTASFGTRLRSGPST